MLEDSHHRTREDPASATEGEEEGDSVIARSIGEVGRWQVQRSAILGLTMVPFACHLLAYPLLSQEKEFWCAEDDDRAFPESYLKKSHENRCFRLPSNDDESRAACERWAFEPDGSLTLQEDFQLVCQYEDLLALRQVVAFAGMLIGCLVTGNLSDRYGRRKVFLALLASWSVFALLHLILPHGRDAFCLYLVLQFCLSFSCLSAWATSWVWVMEIVCGKWRTILGLGNFVFWSLGCVMTTVTVLKLPDWRQTWLVLSLPTLGFVFYAWAVPESPLWLFCNGREAEAKVILRRIAAHNGSQPMSEEHWKKLLEVRQSSSASVSSQSSHGSLSYEILSLVRTPNVRKKSLILFLSWFFCSLTYFGLSLNAVNVGSNVYVTFLLIGLIELPAIALSMVNIVALGRRLPLLLLQLASGLVCVGTALIPVGYFPHDWPAVALTVLGKFCSTSCVHILFVYTSEIYATSTRNTGVAFCNVFARVAGMVAPLVAKLDVFHPFLPVTVFGMGSLLTAFAAASMPETKGVKLPETIEESEAFGANDTLWNKIKREKNGSTSSTEETEDDPPDYRHACMAVEKEASSES